jgi:hypothetical protein
VIWIPSAKVAVAFPEAPESHRGIKISQNVRGVLQSEIGIVVATGEWLEEGQSPRIKSKVARHTAGHGPLEFPAIGHRVLCASQDGTRIRHPEGLDVYELRIYGYYATFTASPFRCEWWLSIMAEEIEPGKWAARPEHVLIRPDAPEERTKGGLWLPPTAQRRSAYGEIISVGALVDDLEPGMRVCFDPHGCHAIQRCDDGSLDGLVPAHIDAILTVIEPD